MQEPQEMMSLMRAGSGGSGDLSDSSDMHMADELTRPAAQSMQSYSLDPSGWNDMNGSLRGVPQPHPYAAPFEHPTLRSEFLGADEDASMGLSFDTGLGMQSIGSLPAADASHPSLMMNSMHDAEGSLESGQLDVPAALQALYQERSDDSDHRPLKHVKGRAEESDDEASEESEQEERKVKPRRPPPVASSSAAAQSAAARAIAASSRPAAAATAASSASSKPRPKGRPPRSKQPATPQIEWVTSDEEERKPIPGVEIADADEDDPDAVYEVAYIRGRQSNGKGGFLYCIRWDGRYKHPKFDTWEPKANLSACQETLERFNRRLHAKKQAARDRRSLAKLHQLEADEDAQRLTAGEAARKRKRIESSSGSSSSSRSDSSNDSSERSSGSSSDQSDGAGRIRKRPKQRRKLVPAAASKPKSSQPTAAAPKTASQPDLDLLREHRKMDEKRARQAELTTIAEPKAAASSSARAALTSAAAASADADDEDKACSVCNRTDHADDNLIIFCDGPGCTVAVHQNCYGVTEIPPGDEPWLCYVCASPERARDPKWQPRCLLCPVQQEGAAFMRVCYREGEKPRSNVAEFCHVACAEYGDPNINYFPDQGPVGVYDMDLVDPDRWPLVCSICERTSDIRTPSGELRGSACIQCWQGRCPVSFHVLCARQLGLPAKSFVVDHPIALPNGETKPPHPVYYAFCTKHVTKKFDLEEYTARLIKNTRDDMARRKKAERGPPPPKEPRLPTPLEVEFAAAGPPKGREEKQMRDRMLLEEQKQLEIERKAAKVAATTKGGGMTAAAAARATMNAARHGGVTGKSVPAARDASSEESSSSSSSSSDEEDRKLGRLKKGVPLRLKSQIIKPAVPAAPAAAAPAAPTATSSSRVKIPKKGSIPTSTASRAPTAAAPVTSAAAAASTSLSLPVSAASSSSTASLSALPAQIYSPHEWKSYLALVPSSSSISSRRAFLQRYFLNLPRRHANLSVFGPRFLDDFPADVLKPPSSDPNAKAPEQTSGLQFLSLWASDLVNSLSVDATAPQLLLAIIQSADRLFINNPSHAVWRKGGRSDELLAWLGVVCAKASQQIKDELAALQKLIKQDPSLLAAPAPATAVRGSRPAIKQASASEPVSNSSAGGPVTDAGILRGASKETLFIEVGEMLRTRLTIVSSASHGPRFPPGAKTALPARSALKQTSVPIVLMERAADTGALKAVPYAPGTIPYAPRAEVAFSSVTASVGGLNSAAGNSLVVKRRKVDWRPAEQLVSFQKPVPANHVYPPSNSDDDMADDVAPLKRHERKQLKQQLARRSSGGSAAQSHTPASISPAAAVAAPAVQTSQPPLQPPAASSAAQSSAQTSSGSSRWFGGGAGSSSAVGSSSSQPHPAAVSVPLSPAAAIAAAAAERVAAAAKSSAPPPSRATDSVSQASSQDARDRERTLQRPREPDPAKDRLRESDRDRSERERRERYEREDWERRERDRRRESDRPRDDPRERDYDRQREPERERERGRERPSEPERNRDRADRSRVSPERGSLSRESDRSRDRDRSTRDHVKSERSHRRSRSRSRSRSRDRSSRSGYDRDRRDDSREYNRDRAARPRSPPASSSSHPRSTTSPRTPTAALATPSPRSEIAPRQFTIPHVPHKQPIVKQEPRPVNSSAGASSAPSPPNRVPVPPARSFADSLSSAAAVALSRATDPAASTASSAFAASAPAADTALLEDAIISLLLSRPGGMLLSALHDALMREPGSEAYRRAIGASFPDFLAQRSHIFELRPADSDKLVLLRSSGARASASAPGGAHGVSVDHVSNGASNPPAVQSAAPATGASAVASPAEHASVMAQVESAMVSTLQQRPGGVPFADLWESTIQPILAGRTFEAATTMSFEQFLDQRWHLFERVYSLDGRSHAFILRDPEAESRAAFSPAHLQQYAEQTIQSILRSHNGSMLKRLFVPVLQRTLARASGTDSLPKSLGCKFKKFCSSRPHLLLVSGNVIMLPETMAKRMAAAAQQPALLLSSAASEANGSGIDVHASTAAAANLPASSACPVGEVLLTPEQSAASAHLRSRLIEYLRGHAAGRTLTEVQRDVVIPLLDAPGTSFRERAFIAMFGISWNMFLSARSGVFRTIARKPRQASIVLLTQTDMPVSAQSSREALVQHAETALVSILRDRGAMQHSDLVELLKRSMPTKNFQQLTGVTQTVFLAQRAHMLAVKGNMIRLRNTASSNQSDGEHAPVVPGEQPASLLSQLESCIVDLLRSHPAGVSEDIIQCDVAAPILAGRALTEVAGVSWSEFIVQCKDVHSATRVTDQTRVLYLHRAAPVPSWATDAFQEHVCIILISILRDYGRPLLQGDLSTAALHLLPSMGAHFRQLVGFRIATFLDVRPHIFCHVGSFAKDKLVTLVDQSNAPLSASHSRDQSHNAMDVSVNFDPTLASLSSSSCSEDSDSECGDQESVTGGGSDMEVSSVDDLAVAATPAATTAAAAGAAVISSTTSRRVSGNLTSEQSAASALLECRLIEYVRGHPAGRTWGDVTRDVLDPLCRVPDQPRQLNFETVFGVAWKVWIGKRGQVFSFLKRKPNGASMLLLARGALPVSANSPRATLVQYAENAVLSILRDHNGPTLLKDVGAALKRLMPTKKIQQLIGSTLTIFLQKRPHLFIMSDERSVRLATHEDTAGPNAAASAAGGERSAALLSQLESAIVELLRAHPAGVSEDIIQRDVAAPILAGRALPEVAGVTWSSFIQERNHHFKRVMRNTDERHVLILERSSSRSRANEAPAWTSAEARIQQVTSTLVSILRDFGGPMLQGDLASLSLQLFSVSAGASFKEVAGSSISAFLNAHPRMFMCIDAMQGHNNLYALVEEHSAPAAATTAPVAAVNTSARSSTVAESDDAMDVGDDVHRRQAAALSQTVSQGADQASATAGLERSLVEFLRAQPAGSVSVDAAFQQCALPLLAGRTFDSVFGVSQLMFLAQRHHLFEKRHLTRGDMLYLRDAAAEMAACSSPAAFVQHAEQTAVSLVRAEGGCIKQSHLGSLMVNALRYLPRNASGASTCVGILGMSIERFLALRPQLFIMRSSSVGSLVTLTEDEQTAAAHAAHAAAVQAHQHALSTQLEHALTSLCCQHPAGVSVSVIFSGTVAPFLGGQSFVKVFGMSWAQFLWQRPHVFVAPTPDDESSLVQLTPAAASVALVSHIEQTLVDILYVQGTELLECELAHALRVRLAVHLSAGQSFTSISGNVKLHTFLVARPHLFIVQAPAPGAGLRMSIIQLTETAAAQAAMEHAAKEQAKAAHSATLRQTVAAVEAQPAGTATAAAASAFATPLAASVPPSATVAMLERLDGAVVSLLQQHPAGLSMEAIYANAIAPLLPKSFVEATGGVSFDTFIRCNKLLMVQGCERGISPIVQLREQAMRTQRVDSLLVSILRGRNGSMSQGTLGTELHAAMQRQYGSRSFKEIMGMTLGVFLSHRPHLVSLRANGTDATVSLVAPATRTPPSQPSTPPRMPEPALQLSPAPVASPAAARKDVSATAADTTQLAAPVDSSASVPPALSGSAFVERANAAVEELLRRHPAGLSHRAIHIDAIQPLLPQGSFKKASGGVTFSEMLLCNPRLQVNGPTGGGPRDLVLLRQTPVAISADEQTAVVQAHRILLEHGGTMLQSKLANMLHAALRHLWPGRADLSTLQGFFGTSFGNFILKHTDVFDSRAIAGQHGHVISVRGESAAAPVTAGAARLSPPQQSAPGSTLETTSAFSSLSVPLPSMPTPMAIDDDDMEEGEIKEADIMPTASTFTPTVAPAAAATASVTPVVSAPTVPVNDSPAAHTSVRVSSLPPPPPPPHPLTTAMSALSAPTSSAHPQTGPARCRWFASPAGCARGDQCWLLHERATSPPATSPRSSAGSTS